ncbi:MAG: glycosyltransferase family 2 protein [Candidatus Electrothrix sp. GW3-4]|uniref:glycosyltransferase family 2 protein n=1 Tax=Candidatus Electrothrix sp. GW3-4 TaxID=3126740 RepID=UPI0030D4BD8F
MSDEQVSAVNIVIPNWNGLRFLPACLSSIEQQDFVSRQVTVVDNGSSDGSLEYLRENQPQVRVIELPENRGFSAAVNKGILSSSAPFVFLLNNDTELDFSCLSHLVDAAKDLKAFDFFSPKMLSFHNRTVLDGAGDGYLRGGAGYRLGTMELDGPVYNRPGPTFGACAGAVLYRRSLFDHIGLFDEDFFAYLEDVDLNLRINYSGRRGYYVPAAKVYHIGSASSGSKINPFTIRLSTRNSCYVLLKNYPTGLFFRLLPVIVIYQFFWLLFVIKKRQILAYLQGIGKAVIGMRKMRKKHREISLYDSLTSAEFADRLSLAEKVVVESIMRRRSAEGKNNWLLNFYLVFFCRK